MGLMDLSSSVLIRRTHSAKTFVQDNKIQHEEPPPSLQ